MTFCEKRMFKRLTKRYNLSENMENLKYLIYKSKSKFEMLKTQLEDDCLEKYEIGAEGKASAAVFTGSVKTTYTYKASENEIDNIVNQLKEQKELDNTGRKPYVCAKAELTMQRYNRLECTYWHGCYYPRQDVKCVILMAGSQSNILGHYMGDPIRESPSNADFYKILLSDLLDNSKNEDYNHEMKTSADTFAYEIEELMESDYTEQKSYFEFVARVFRRELFDRSSEIWEEFVSSYEKNIKWLNIIYASPLYVALIGNSDRVIAINGKKRIIIHEDFPEIEQFDFNHAYYDNTAYSSFFSRVNKELFEAGLFEEAERLYQDINEILSNYGIHNYEVFIKCLDRRVCISCTQECSVYKAIKGNGLLAESKLYKENMKLIFQQIYAIIRRLYVTQEEWF